MALQAAKNADNHLAGYLSEHKENIKFSLSYFRWCERLILLICSPF